MAIRKSKNYEKEQQTKEVLSKEDFLKALYKSTRIVKKGKSERGKKKTSE